MLDPTSHDADGTYSPLVSCPECGYSVKLEDVRAAGSFPCAGCGQRLRVSLRYQRGMAAVNLALAFPLVYILIVKVTWWAIVMWVPISFLIGIPLTVLAKYVAPPRLERDVSNYSGPLGLGHH